MVVMNQLFQTQEEVLALTRPGTVRAHRTSAVLEPTDLSKAVDECSRAFLSRAAAGGPAFHGRAARLSFPGRVVFRMVRPLASVRRCSSQSRTRRW